MAEIDPWMAADGACSKKGSMESCCLQRSEVDSRKVPTVTACCEVVGACCRMEVCGKMGERNIWQVVLKVPM